MYIDIYICIVNILRDLSHHGILMSSWDTKYSLILYRVPIASTILPVKCSTSILQHNTTTTSTPLPQSAHHRYKCCTSPPHNLIIPFSPPSFPHFATTVRSPALCISPHLYSQVASPVKFEQYKAHTSTAPKLTQSKFENNPTTTWISNILFFIPLPFLSYSLTDCLSLTGPTNFQSPGSVATPFKNCATSTNLLHH